MQNILVAILLAFAVGGVLGATGGYRYANGRAAVADIRAAQSVAAAATDAIADSREILARANKETSRAIHRDVAVINTQTMKRMEYAQAPKPDAACVMPDDTFRLLVDAVRRANASADSATAAD